MSDLTVTASTKGSARCAPLSRARRELQDQLEGVHRSIDALDVIIEQLYSVCRVAGASNGGTVGRGNPAFAEDVDSEDGLRDAWKRVTALGVERKALRREAAALTAALDDLERSGTSHALRCQVCGHEMTARRSDQRYCSAACKQRAWRQGMARTTPSKRRTTPKYTCAACAAPIRGDALRFTAAGAPVHAGCAEGPAAWIGE